MEHFLISGDETNLIANPDGEMKTIGEFGRRKHEKKVSDCRSSATMFRTGTAGGNNGPTVFIMAGKRVQQGYDSKYLIWHGAVPGSSIQMTQKAFMTDKCWLDMTPNLFEGYRLLPFLQDNPQWYAIEIVEDVSN